MTGDFPVRLLVGANYNEKTPLNNNQILVHTVAMR